MSIGCRMRGLGVSSHYTKILKPHLDEICGDTKYVLKNSMDNGVIVHTDRIEDEKFSLINEIVDENRGNGKINTYNHNMEISWRDINKYAKCMTLAEMASVNPDYANDLTSEGEWIYPLPEMVNMSCSAGNGIGWRNNWKIKRWSVDLPKATNTKNLFKNSSLVSFVGDLPLIKGDGYYQMFSEWGNRTFKSFEGDLSGLVNGGQFFWGHGMLIFNSSLPSLSTAWSMFGYAELNKQSALRVLNSIPSYTSGDHPLTIGIHIDHQNDEELLTAISNAESKGWTLGVQWNGTPTNTASVMRFGQLIYAKVDEMERPDDTTKRMLDWGHYVTDPTGYETFRSLESAYDYFNLEMPISEV